MDNVISIGIWCRLKRDRDIGRKAVLSDVKTAFTFTPALRLAIDFSFMYEIQKAKMMFKSLNGLAPLYLQDLFSERHTDYDLRDSFPGGGGVLPIMAYTEWLCPEGVRFSGFRYLKG